MKRGEIYFVDLEGTVGSEINKRRPCIVIQNDVGNRFANTTIVLPISCHSRRPYPTQMILNEGMVVSGREKLNGVIKTEQIRTVDKQRVGTLVGTLTSEAMEMVNRLVLTALGI